MIPVYFVELSSANLAEIVEFQEILNTHGLNLIYTKNEGDKKELMIYSPINLDTDSIEFELKKIRRKENGWKCCPTCQKWSRKMLNCAGCKVEFYCSKKCQKKDWKNHKKVCNN